MKRGLVSLVAKRPGKSLARPKVVRASIKLGSRQFITSCTRTVPPAAVIRSATMSAETVRAREWKFRFEEVCSSSGNRFEWWMKAMPPGASLRMICGM